MTEFCLAGKICKDTLFKITRNRYVIVAKRQEKLTKVEIVQWGRVFIQKL